jgi:hypothetical protein
MTNIVCLERAPRVPEFPQQFCPATQQRVAKTLEAADEAELAGEWALADRLIALARQEVAQVRARIGWMV